MDLLNIKDIKLENIEGSDQVNQNQELNAKGNKFEKTGTTIVGIRYKTGIVLCADTRSTSGPVVSNKNTKKVHKVAEKIYCCGAGVSADNTRVCMMVHNELQQFSYRFHKDPLVTHAERLFSDYLFERGGQISANIILGGIDPESGPLLAVISEDGYSKYLPYAILGSGSYAASGVVDSRYKEDLTKKEALEIGCDSVRAAILSDLYSGSNIDVTIIDEDGTVEDLRNYIIVEKKRTDGEIKYPLNSVKITKEEVFNIVKEI